MFNMQSKSSIINLTIIGILVVIASVIFRQQFYFNPAVTALSSTGFPSESAVSDASAIDLSSALPSESGVLSSQSAESSSGSELSSSTRLKPMVRLTDPVVPMSKSEFFNEQTLSDKIDGKAELYIPSGFKSLTCQRFKSGTASETDNNYVLDTKSGAHSDSEPDRSYTSAANSSNTFSSGTDSDLWLEFFLYDMGTTENAFSVFSRQRRENSTPLSIAYYAYQTENALFFVHGQFYIEIIASLPSKQALQYMSDMGENFIKDHPDPVPEKMGVADLFPSKSKKSDKTIMVLNKEATKHDRDNTAFNTDEIILDKNSIKLITSDGFGFDRLDHVYTANYIVNGAYMTAFISERDSSEAAADLAEGYGGFLSAFGGNNIDIKGIVTGSKVNNIHAVEIMDTIEIIFSVGPYFAGVREAEDPEKSKILVRAIQSKLNDSIRSSKFDIKNPK